MYVKINYRFSVAKVIILIAWTLSLFGYFFQFPFSRLSSLIVPGLAIYLIGLFINQC